jgi:surface protein
MKKLSSIFNLIVIILFSFLAEGQNPFITTWQTNKPGTSNNNQITIPGTGTNYQIDWEEVGNPVNNGTAVGNDATTITFPSIGIYRISLSGNFTRIYFNGSGDCTKILTIEQWGDISWISMESAFSGCYYLTHNATDVPNLSAVTSMAYMFAGCHFFDGDIGSWNTQNITNMGGLFYGAPLFNKPIGNWNVTNVTNMLDMFNGANHFNQDLSNWDVSSVYNMAAMFGGATAFNQPIGNWNTVNVTNMEHMFQGASAFNQPIGNWNTTNVISMYGMFSGATSFSQDLSNWNTTNVSNMIDMFHGASNFNGNISTWDVSNVTNMNAMFKYALYFNNDIGNWNVGNVTSMNSMFEEAHAFNNYIGNWNTSNVSNMGSMFYAAVSFNQEIENWDVTNVTSMNSMFKFAYAFNKSLGNWTLNNSVILENFLSHCGMNCSNYDNTLIEWNANPLTPNGRIMGAGAGERQYWQSLNARNNLINVKGWSIVGDYYSNCDYPLFTCTSLTSPSNGATNVPINSNLSWNPVSNASGYKLSIGITPGGTEILNNFDVGNVTTYNPVNDFACGVLIYVKITPYDSNGGELSCPEESFTTVIVLPNASATDETGNDTNDGTATANPSGGVSPYTFLWNTGHNSQIITGLSPGTYTVTVTDQNGCTGSQSVIVNEFNSGIVQNVGINTQNPEPCAALDVTSTNSGFLPPRMTNEQRNSIINPVAGLIIWCTNCGTNGELEVYNGTAWTNMIGGAVAP